MAKVNMHLQLSWTRKERGSPVKICKIGPHYWGVDRHYKSTTVSELTDNIYVTIDVDEIARIVMGSAAANKSGKAQIMGGLIKAKVVSRAVLGSQVHQNPIPEGYEEIP